MPTHAFTENAEKYFSKIEENPENLLVPEETKKFNLKLSKGDLDFLKFLSNKDGISRNQLIENLVENIIYDFLVSLETEEYILLIKKADEFNSIDGFKNMKASWISNLYPSQIPEEQIYCDLERNRAPIEMQDRSERYKKMFNLIKDSKLAKSNEV